MFIPSSYGWSWHNMAFFVVVLLYFSCKPSLIAIGALESDSFCKLSATMWAHQVRWVRITEIPWSGINAWEKKYVKYDQIWLKSLYPCCSHQTSPLSFIHSSSFSVGTSQMTHPPTNKKSNRRSWSRQLNKSSPYKALFQALLLDATSGWSQTRKENFCQGLDHHLIGFHGDFIGI